MKYEYELLHQYNFILWCESIWLHFVLQNVIITLRHWTELWSIIVSIHLRWNFRIFRANRWNEFNINFDMMIFYWIHNLCYTSMHFIDCNNSLYNFFVEVDYTNHWQKFNTDLFVQFIATFNSIQCCIYRKM